MNLLLNKRQVTLLCLCVDKQIAEDHSIKAMYDMKAKTALTVAEADEAKAGLAYFTDRIRQLQRLREMIG